MNGNIYRFYDSSPNPDVGNNKLIKKVDGTPSTWWTRSQQVDGGNNNAKLAVSVNGLMTGQQGYTKLQIMPGFCI